MHFPPFSLPHLFATAALFVCCPAFSAANDATPPEPATAVILTPQAPPEPRINGPVVFGARPGHPFLYSIPATGRRPMRFAASDLPAGLKLDAETGRISGQVSAPGEYRVTLRAKNALGEAAKEFRILIGEEIALTPPMGWNSWNCWGERVDAEKVLRSARALVAAGLDQHGWSYVNIDDTWQGERGGPEHALQPDPKRFPDMKKVADEVHALGLKCGIYSTPWTKSYARRLGGSSENPAGTKDEAWNRPAKIHIHQLPFDVGQYHFTSSDARQWAAWGMDYLKYDWGPVDIANAREMAEALRASGRDMVYSISNNGSGNVYSIVAELAPLANAWRITDDISNSWASMSRNGFDKDQWASAQRPGHYNDPDMLLVGHIGWGNPLPSRLTPDEQYSHLSLWCMLGAPLLLGCDLEKLDDFTLNLLTNDEVLAIDQDPLCQQGTRVANLQGLEVHAKPLADGSLAVALFNRTGKSATITARWSDLKVSGPRRVRDLWRQKDLGTSTETFSAAVPTHGVVLVRLFPVR